MLRRGSRGESVTWLQGLLNKIRQGGDRQLKVDGIFGGNTVERVKDFQRRNGLAVDGIVGPNTLHMLWVVEDPNGYGIDVGVYSGPALPPGGLPPSATENSAAAPKPPPAKARPKVMTEAEVRQMMKDSLSPQGWNWVSAKGKDLVFLLSRAADVGKIANACGVLDGVVIGAAAPAGPLFAAIGGFLFPIGATFSWHRAVTTNERHYGWLACCYATTYWMFQEGSSTLRSGSKAARERHEWLRDAEDMAKLDKAWKLAWDEQISRLNARDWKGHSKSAVRETVQMLYNNSASKFCDGMRAHILETQLSSWTLSDTERQNWKSFDSIKYPK